MCRFLLVKSNNEFDPQPFLRAFSSMCEKSRTPDGDRQEDGWGTATKVQSSKFKVQSWKLYKSLNPIWQDKDKFSRFPETNIFVAHVRSASFAKDKGKIDYNQPYVNGDLSYVFNGKITGVRLNMPLAGTLGAQKLFSLLKIKLKGQRVEQALRSVTKTMHQFSKSIEGMNLGLIKGNKFYVLCHYQKDKDYFSLYYYQDNGLKVVCSEPLTDMIKPSQWRMMKKGEILVL